MAFFTNQPTCQLLRQCWSYSAWANRRRGHADPQAGALPANDGHYYLVGARASQQVYSPVMGTANALEALLTRALALRLSVHLTDPFYDIDIAADLNQLADELQRLPRKRQERPTGPRNRSRIPFYPNSNLRSAAEF
jgi:hypothetical protein